MWSQLTEFLLPGHCLLCGLVSDGGQICAGCARDLPRSGPSCPVCAMPVSPQTHSSPTVPCGRCLVRSPPWDAARAALLYCYPTDHLVRRFKFARDLCAGRLLAQELLRATRRCDEMPDVLLPVPLHRTRYFLRTFNQAELLARELGTSLQIPVDTGFLLRRRHTRAQSGLDAAGRRRNTRGAFALKPRTARSAMPRHVALVDDVLTTGATLAECTRVLKRAGAARVTVWVAARAPLP